MINHVPSNARTPFVRIGFDASRADSGPTSLRYVALFIGQMISTGTALPNVRTTVSSPEDAGLKFGFGSQLHVSLEAWFRVNKRTKVYVIPLADANDSVKRIAKFDVVAAAGALEDGRIAIYIAGKRYVVNVLTEDTEDEIVAKMVAAVNSDASCPFVASNGGISATDKFWLTGKNSGTTTNDLDIRFNFREGEKFPSGVDIVSAGADVAGSVDPDVAGIVIPMMAEQWYQVIVSPYNDKDTLDAFDTELESRFGAERQIDGTYITAKVTANLSDLETFGLTRNSKHMMCIHANGSPSSTWAFAAIVAAYNAQEGERDAAVPFTRLIMPGIVAPLAGSEYNNIENDTLLHSGISTWTVDAFGNVRIQSLITMYRVNDANVTDESYLYINTMNILRFLRYDFRSQIDSRYSRAKLAKDSTRLPSGQLFMTPMTAKTEAIAIFRGWEDKGYAEGMTQFIEDLVTEIDSDNANQMNWNISPDLVNMFLFGSVNIQFKLN